MKQRFKRFFALATAVCCLCPCIAANVFAQETNIVRFDEVCNKQEVGSVPNGEITISVVPSKDTLNVGEEFYVDFILENNPGFSAYGFTVDYDSDVIVPVKGNTGEMDSISQVKYGNGKAAVDSDGINNGIDVSSDKKSFAYTNFLLNNGDVDVTSDNGILFRVNFKTVGNGTSKIDLSDRLGVVLCDDIGDNFIVYIKNASVSVSGGEDRTETTTASSNNNDSDDNNDDNRNTEITSDSESDTETTTESESKDEETQLQAESNTDSEETTKIKVNIPKDMSDAKNFNDTDEVPWAVQSINRLSSLGIINGVDDMTFNPKAYTYRADFVIVISRLLGLDTDASNTFSDVEDSAYYAKAVSMASSLDLVKGSGGMFMPKNNITRQDVMVILSRVLEKAGKANKSDENVLNGFSDREDISPYAVSAVSDLVGMGIVNGDNNGRLNPKGYINRAEMAVIINKVYDVL